VTAHRRGKRVIREPKSPILDAEFAADEAKRVFGLWLDAARELRDYLALAAQRFHGAANGDVLVSVRAIAVRSMGPLVRVQTR